MSNRINVYELGMKSYLKVKAYPPLKRTWGENTLFRSFATVILN